MKYLPFENITYKTKLNKGEIQNRLSENIEPKKILRFRGILSSNNHKPYEGSITGAEFNVNRIIKYKNSFLPRISGMIDHDISGSLIHVKMRLSVFMIVFLCIWFGGVGIGCFFSLSVLLTRSNFEPILLIPIGLFVFVYMIVILGFKYESTKSKQFLTQLFEAEVVE